MERFTSSLSSSENNQVRRVVLSDIIAERLQAYILEQQLQPGDVLPTEQQLMAQFGVSRTVIREAARVLVQRGLVDVRPGRGMTVIAPSIEAFAQHLTALLRTDQASADQLFELRELLEPAITRVAARARTPVDLDALSATLQRAEEHAEDVDICVTCDIAFHEGLAEATHNPFFVLVTAPISALLRRTYRSAFSYLSHHPYTLVEHRAILDAVIARNEERAGAASLAHLTRVRRSLKEILSEQANIAQRETRDGAERP